jgi:hypothetical protein
MITSCALSAEVLTDKTHILGAATNGGTEIQAIRGVRAELQNDTLAGGAS